MRRRRVVVGVEALDRGELDEIGADDVSNRAGPAQDGQRLPVAEAARRRRARRRHDGGVQRVDVERHVDRPAGERLDDLLDVPARLVLGPMDRDAIAIGVVELHLGRGDSADADRHQRNARMVQHAAHGRGVREMLALIAVAQVGVGIELQHHQVLVARSERADGAGRQRMLAAEHERKLAGRQHRLDQSRRADRAPP